jgi:hypothetical protein
LFALAFHMHSLSRHGRLDRHRFDGLDEFSGDRGVDAQTAKRKAPRQTQHRIATIAPVHGLIGTAGVDYG